MVGGVPQSSSASADDDRCPICGARQWRPLAEVGPRSMASDWRVLDHPLRKRACLECGVIANAANADAGAHSMALFERGYGLYAHPPGSDAEAARQAAYASWIVAAIGSTVPSRVLDVGCGNGSLLRALATHWPTATLMGCDPSIEAITLGATPRLRLWRGSASDIPADAQADLVISVNVVEHTRDPLSFLRSLASALSPGGTLLVICPDASTPDTQLLIADHEWSLTPSHRDALFARAGLAIRRAERAPAALGAFQLAVAQVARDPVHASAPPPGGSLQRSEDYLRRWASLDNALRLRVGEGPVVCFGIGEAAGLLRAYAPRTWVQVRVCTADAVPTGACFGDVPVVALGSVGRGTPLLLAVRPRDQRQLASRLSASFDAVVTWYDLVEAD